MTHKVLCIDDEPHNLEALERLLRKKYQVHTASSGGEALEKIKHDQFSAIISDQKMPQMTGVEFFVHARAEQPEAVRILLTGYTDLESVIDSINKGQIYRYITKPWEPEELLAVLAQALEVFELKKLVQKQNQDLIQANNELRSLDQLKSDFMALINHELKTPLTGISSYTQLLSEEKLNDEQKLYVEKIQLSTDRLQRLIQDTLLITRIRSNTENRNDQSVAPLLIAEKTWNELNQKGTNKLNLELALVGDKNYQVSSDAHNLTVLMDKLLHNCFRYSQDKSKVTIQLDQNTHGWSLQVQSLARSAPPANITDLLSAFSTNTPIMNHNGGTGLGLAVAQAITHWLGGKMRLEVQGHQWLIELSWTHSD